MRKHTYTHELAPTNTGSRAHGAAGTGNVSSAAADAPERKETGNAARRHPVRRRTRNQGSDAHPRKLTIRMTEQLSNRVASLQGLIWKYGNRETMADIFEKVLFPALQRYVAPLVDAAKADREAQMEGATV